MNFSFWGYSQTNHLPFLFKAFLFLLISIIALMNFINVYLKIIIAVLLVICRQILLGGKTRFGIYIFLLISSIMIILFWFIFENDIFLKNGIHAITKLWLLFLSGNVFLLSISQNELINNGLKFNVSKDVLLLLAVSLNSINYFMESFKIILKSYKARNCNRNILRKYYYCLITIAIDSLFLIVECKKVYSIYYEQIMSSLEIKEV